MTGDTVRACGTGSAGNGNDHAKEACNGDVGLVADVDPEAGGPTARFEGRDLLNGFGERDALVLAHARRCEEPGLRISGGGDPGADPELRDGEAEPDQYRRDVRIASPELFLLIESLPHRKCSGSGSIGGGRNEDGEHDDT